MKIGIFFYSTYGHTYHLAKAIREGALQVDGSEVDMLQIQETLSTEILKKMGALEAKKIFEDIHVAKPHDLEKYDALIFGTPTRFGNMSAQMRAFFDATGSLWTKGSLIGKVGSVFVSTGSQHGGHETTIQSVHTTLLHHGMIIAGVPYSCIQLVNMNEITGGSPYGAGTIAGADGSRMPSNNELEIARQQGIFVAKIAKKLTMNL
jgi:NAD(P)H dehydrogenase (quinone)